MHQSPCLAFVAASLLVLDYECLSQSSLVDIVAFAAAFFVVLLDEFGNSLQHPDSRNSKPDLLSFFDGGQLSMKHC